MKKKVWLFINANYMEFEPKTFEGFSVSVGEQEIEFKNRNPIEAAEMFQNWLNTWPMGSYELGHSSSCSDFISDSENFLSEFDRMKLGDILFPVDKLIKPFVIAPVEPIKVITSIEDSREVKKLTDENGKELSREEISSRLYSFAVNVDVPKFHDNFQKFLETQVREFEEQFCKESGLPKNDYYKILGEEVSDNYCSFGLKKMLWNWIIKN